jgi:hypothetical protein
VPRRSRSEANDSEGPNETASERETERGGRSRRAKSAQERAALNDP